MEMDDISLANVGEKYLFQVFLTLISVQPKL